MISRREALLGASALAVSESVCAPVRSLLGGQGNRLAEIQKPSLPYVTEGLVAMWDGIWNIGIGKHDNASRIWKDIVGNRDLELRGSAYFSYDRLFNTASNGAATYKLDAIEGIRSFEIGFIANNTYATILNIGEGIYLFHRNGQLWCNGTGSAHTSVIYEHAAIAKYTASTEMHMSFVTNGSSIEIVKAYNDAINVTSLVGADWWSCGTCCTIGGYYNSYNNRALDGSVMYVRLYSRALTADEIAYNHEVDKARFNLQ